MEIDSEAILITLREEIEAKDADLAAHFYTMEDYYERKLWHQLTELLKTEVYKNPNSIPIRLRLFLNFIYTFSEKLNKLQLVEFFILSLTELTPYDKLEYLNDLNEKLVALGENQNSKSTDLKNEDRELIQARIYLKNELAIVKLQLGFIDEASSIIDQSEDLITESTIPVDNRVNANFYYAKAQLMKLLGDFNSAYYNNLLFLACIPNIQELERKEFIVEDICINGLLGDKIYNFGEIIMHEIFNYLGNQWLKELILSLNNGDLVTFEKLISNEKYKDFNLISGKIEFLTQKLCIMAFIELVFNKPSTNRCITYNEILQKISLIKNGKEIESLLMKCLSLGLIKGLINQVEENVEVSWIQPRTMTLTQIQNMKDKIEIWNEKVASLNRYMGECGGELYV